MTILSRSLLVAAMVVTLATPASAQKAGCPTSKGDRADDAEDKVATWNGLAHWYRDYAACDDGETGEGVDDKVAKLFSSRWDELMTVAPTFEKNPGLRRFLLRHIDVVGMSTEQARALGQQARTQCPPANAALCRDIAHEADATLKESLQ